MLVLRRLLYPGKKSVEVTILTNQITHASKTVLFVTPGFIQLLLEESPVT